MTTGAPPHFTISTGSLSEIVEVIVRLKRDCPDAPIRFEVALDIWFAMNQRMPDVLAAGFTLFPGIGIYPSRDLAPGEWAPVFRVGTR